MPPDRGAFFAAGPCVGEYRELFCSPATTITASWRDDAGCIPSRRLPGPRAADERARRAGCRAAAEQRRLRGVLAIPAVAARDVYAIHGHTPTCTRPSRPSAALRGRDASGSRLPATRHAEPTVGCAAYAWMHIPAQRADHSALTVTPGASRAPGCRWRRGSPAACRASARSRPATRARAALNRLGAPDRAQPSAIAAVARLHGMREALVASS